MSCLPIFAFIFCEWFMYSCDRSAYFAAAKQADQSWEYINRSQIHECRNWVRVLTVSFLGIHNSEFRYNVPTRHWSLAFHWSDFYMSLTVLDYNSDLRCCSLSWYHQEWWCNLGANYYLNYYYLRVFLISYLISCSTSISNIFRMELTTLFPTACSVV